MTLAIAVQFLAAAPAEAEDKPDVVCVKKSGICLVVVEGDATGSGADSNGRPADGSGKTCHGPSGVVPCYDDDYGWYSEADDCYYRKASPQPPADDAVWEGRSTGAIYLATCLGTAGTGGGLVWRSDPPPGFGGSSATPAELADRAIRQMRLQGPEIGIVPEPGKTGLVGLPVWMWTQVTPQTWGPVTVTASIPGLSVTATAKAEHIAWSMGDGSTVECANPGTPYEDRFGAQSSPTCGHTYTRTSARLAGAVYPVTATTTWRVTWAGGGQRGVLTLDRVTTTQLRIGELQVLVQ